MPGQNLQAQWRLAVGLPLRCLCPALASVLQHPPRSACAHWLCCQAVPVQEPSAAEQTAAAATAVAAAAAVFAIAAEVVVVSVIAYWAMKEIAPQPEGLPKWALVTAVSLPAAVAQAAAAVVGAAAAVAAAAAAAAAANAAGTSAAADAALAGQLQTALADPVKGAFARQMVSA